MDAQISFACDICGKSYKHKIDMTTHRRIHLKKKPYECEICKTAFSQRNAIDKHERIHTRRKAF